MSEDRKRRIASEINESITSPAVLQAPGTSLLTRPVAPTTIIKQGSTVHTTVTATTTLQRPPVLQVTPAHFPCRYLFPGVAFAAFQNILAL